MAGIPYHSDTVDGEAEKAIELVEKVARNLHAREEQTADAVSRVQGAVKATKEKVAQVAGRADETESALEQAQAEITELLERLQTAHDEARNLQKLLSTKDVELASTTKRAAKREETANRVVADLHKIADAVRRGLPVVAA